MLHFYAGNTRTNKRYRNAFSSIHAWINYKADMEQGGFHPYKYAGFTQRTIVLQGRVFHIRDEAT